MDNSMMSHEPTSTTGELAIDLLIVMTVWFSDRIYDILLFFVTPDSFHTGLVDLKDFFGLIVGMLGTYLMIIKIQRAKKKKNESEENK